MLAVSIFAQSSKELSPDRTLIPIGQKPRLGSSHAIISVRLTSFAEAISDFSAGDFLVNNAIPVLRL
jgi:hypothetical protein